ncbi:phosphoribosylanthranilate isomerase [Methanofollis fontis]|uniref:N-(5'-phosphoribosyl)anthranilate isomerase n=1 Tax=Methanofollis fontis TaxID=2052832 RepID=A0A483CYD3_9EURY|nr:phosphoribosylanthranilate isomerase [Methanofollis fontis]TAJ45242.1 N-(5'-phosphoribosyl)anthranilate isomerase [Methanofollis fontis]
MIEEVREMRVKICGLTSPEDAAFAARAGADAVGVVMYSDSPRSIDERRAREIFAAVGPFTATVVVTHTTSAADLAAIIALRPTAVQIFYPHQVDEDAPVRVIRAVGGGRMPPFPGKTDAYIVDESMGRGRAFDPIVARRFLERCPLPVVLAGGLTPGNVGSAVSLHPYAVDVCSGVEVSPGVKDRAKVLAFIRAAKADPVQTGRPA